MSESSGRPPQPDDPTSNDTNMLLCEPAGNQLSILSGSEQRPCGRCSVPVWVSPAGLAFSAENPTEIVCIPCGLKEDWGDEEAGPVPGTPSNLMHMVVTKHGLARLQAIVEAWRRGRTN